MDLIKYYIDNINKDEFHSVYLNEIQTLHDNILYDEIYGSGRMYSKIEVFDVEDAIQQYKQLLSPQNENNYDSLNNKFIVLSYYLYKNGYHIKQFPRVIERPPSLKEFAYNDIKTYILHNSKENEDFSSGVSWSLRRELIKSLTIVPQLDYNVPKNIEDVFAEISVRNSKFNNMSVDEKLRIIIEAIEHILKPDENGKYIDLDNDMRYTGLFKNSDVKEYRKLLQCFRHATKQNLQERSELRKQSDHLIHYGLSILSSLVIFVEKD